MSHPQPFMLIFQPICAGLGIFFTNASYLESYFLHENKLTKFYAISEIIRTVVNGDVASCLLLGQPDSHSHNSANIYVRGGPFQEKIL